MLALLLLLLPQHFKVGLGQAADPPGTVPGNLLLLHQLLLVLLVDTALLLQRQAGRNKQSQHVLAPSGQSDSITTFCPFQQAKGALPERAAWQQQHACHAHS